MRKGAWHQLGWQCQNVALDQIIAGTGVGVILSPGDVALKKAKELATKFTDAGASLLYDPQWYNPKFSNARLATYPAQTVRASVTTIGKWSDTELGHFAAKIVHENDTLKSDAVIIPAITYAAGRTDIVRLNERIHSAVRNEARKAGRPVYASVFLNASICDSLELILETLSAATKLNCDGWYFGFEFRDTRLPTNTAAVYRCLFAQLTLALTGKPVLHAFAGPMGILSIGAGATGAAIGRSKSLWMFKREKWEPNPAKSSGGKGKYPSRYFSRNLWGTIVTPDELGLLGNPLRSSVITPSPYGPDPLPIGWNHSSSKKHLLHTVCSTIQEIANAPSLQESRDKAKTVLEVAIDNHKKIRASSITLKDSTAAYQENWKAAVEILERKHADDFEILEMLS